MERQAKDGTFYQKVGDDEWSPVTRTAKDGTVYKKVGTDEWTPEKEQSFAEKATRQVLDVALPVAGAVGAGMLATPETFGAATIPAGAAGYAAGKQLSRIAKQKLFGDKPEAQSMGDLAKQTGADLAEGAAAEMGGQAIGKGLEVAAPHVMPHLKPIFNKAGDVIGYIGEKIAAAAEKNMAKAVGAGAKEMENIAGARAIGRNALDNNLKGPYTSARDAAERAKALKESAGQSMDEVYRVVDESGPAKFNPLDTATKVEAELAPQYRTKINKSEVGQLENTLDSILARGDKNISLSEAQSLKKEIDSVAYPKGKKPLDPTPKQQMAQDASRIIREHIDEAAKAGAEELNSPELINKLAEARKAYGVNKQTEKLLTKQAGREEMSTGQKINWTIDPVKFGSSVVKKFGPNIQATEAIALDKVGNAIKSAPKAAEKAAAIAEKTVPRAATSKLSEAARSAGQVAEKAADKDNPKKGPAKWANDGLKKLEEHSGKTLDKGALLENPKAKKLLIAASDLKIGSKAMDKILEELNGLEEK